MDQNGIQDNLQNLTQQTDKLIVNFDESFKIPIYISQQLKSEQIVDKEEY